jgi:CRP/FNR family cyclic AMP-dependent transcriptional regulator
MARKQAQTDPHPLAESLRAVDLFSDLEPRELDVLANMARDYQFAPGEVVVAEGDRSGRFHLVVEGHAVTTVGDKPVAELGPGDYFGEVAMIDRQPRTATVTATDDLRTLSLASISVRPMLREHPDIALKLLEKVCARLRAADAQLH